MIMSIFMIVLLAVTELVFARMELVAKESFRRRASPKRDEKLPDLKTYRR